MQVEFKLELDQKVFTPFGRRAIVTMLGIDSSGKQAHVMWEDEGGTVNRSWFDESKMCAAHEENEPTKKDLAEFKKHCSSQGKNLEELTWEDIIAAFWGWRFQH